MELSETLKLALSAIWAHKLRSFLTLLGMIIAVAAFMVVDPCKDRKRQVVEELSSEYKIRKCEYEERQWTERECSGRQDIEPLKESVQCEDRLNDYPEQSESKKDFRGSRLGPGPIDGIEEDADR